MIQKETKNGFNLPVIPTVRTKECSKEMGNIPCKINIRAVVHSHIGFGYYCISISFPAYFHAHT